MLIPLLAGAISCACQAGEEVKDKASGRFLRAEGGQSQVECCALRGTGAEVRH